MTLDDLQDPRFKAFLSLNYPGPIKPKPEDFEPCGIIKSKVTAAKRYRLAQAAALMRIV